MSNLSMGRIAGHATWSQSSARPKLNSAKFAVDTSIRTRSPLGRTSLRMGGMFQLRGISVPLGRSARSVRPIMCGGEMRRDIKGFFLR